jgi:DNA helicase IV
MRDIVATIQAEQDEIIRLNHPEVLVIEGGPGTGKTVVALHRVILIRKSSVRGQAAAPGSATLRRVQAASMVPVRRRVGG